MSNGVLVYVALSEFKASYELAMAIVNNQVSAGYQLLAIDYCLLAIPWLGLGQDIGNTYGSGHR